MEILWWLAPPVVVTALAMLAVGWWGREERSAVDRDVAVARLARALDPPVRRGPLGGLRRRRMPGYAAPLPPSDRSSGVAVRRPAP